MPRRSSLSRRPQLSPLRLGSIPEYDSDVDLNLGAESPASVLRAEITDSVSEDEWAKSGIAVHTSVPSRNRVWRSNSFSKRNRDLQRETVDRDCGICFEVAVMPCRTQCCGKLFCLEHIAEWLHGSSSDGRCPSCKSPCSLGINTISLAPPGPPSAPSPPYVDQGFLTMPKPTKPAQPLVLLMQGQEMELPRSASPSSSSTGSETSGISSTSSDEQLQSPPVVRRKASQSTLFSPSTLSNPEVMGGAAERILSLIGLTLLLYVLLN